MTAFISIVSVCLPSLSRLKSGRITICWFVCWTILSIISSVMRQFHASKGVAAFLAWPMTPGNFVRIFCHLYQMSVQLFTSFHNVLSFPIKTTVRTAHSTAAIIIQRSVFCTLSHLFHASITYSIPSSDIIIIARIRSTSSALLWYKRSKMAAGN